MIPKMTPEMSDALANENEVCVRDPSTERVYVLVDHETHRRAMAALRQQADIDAIQAGIDDMEAGRMQPAADARRHGRNELLSRFEK